MMFHYQTVQRLIHIKWTVTVTSNLLAFRQPLPLSSVSSLLRFFPLFLTTVSFNCLLKCRNLIGTNLAMILLILDKEEEKYNQTWIRKIFSKVKLVGKYHGLFKEFKDHEISIHKYFTMPQHQFCVKLKKIFKSKSVHFEKQLALRIQSIYFNWSKTKVFFSQIEVALRKNLCV